MIWNLIKETIKPGTIIQKPKSKKKYHFLGCGVSRGEESFVYELPTNPNTKRSSKKRIPCSAFNEAYKILLKNGEITKTWFASAFPKVNADGGCNFTTLGGVFQIIKLAEWINAGTYRRL